MSPTLGKIPPAGIAIESAKNGGPDIKDVLTAMQASHLDATQGRLELSAKIDRTTRELHKEVTEAAKQRKIDIEASSKVVREDLVVYREQQIKRCAEEHRKLFEEEFTTHIKPRAARRSEDPETIDYSKTSIFPEIAFSYKFFKWIVAVVVVILMGWGITFWADSCARQHYWGEQAPTLIASPSPSPSQGVAE